MNLHRRVAKLEAAKTPAQPDDPERAERARQAVLQIIEWSCRELKKPPRERYCKDQLIQAFTGMRSWVTEHEPPSPVKDRWLVLLGEAVKEVNRES
jgi:hypothetical protein